MEVEAGVSLGSNLGDRAGNLRAAVAALSAVPGARLAALSSMYETEPVDVPAEFSGCGYLNAAAVFAVEGMTAEAWSARCHAAEDALGRVRTGWHHPRTIDIDLLWFGDERRDEPHLRLPHPLATTRRFVCAPLAEIRPDLRLPGVAATIREALSAMPPRPWARKTSEPWGAAVATAPEGLKP